MIPEENSCEEAINYLNKKILEEYKKEGIYDLIKEDPRKQPVASVVIYSKYYNQIWMIGDCKALYGNNTIDNELEIDIMYAKDVSEIAFCTDGYRKIFATLNECETYNKFIKENDPLGYKEYSYEKRLCKESRKL